MIRRLFSVTALMIASSSLAAHAQAVIAIQGGRVLTVTQGVIETGTLVIENGKIVAVGSNVAVPAGARVIDARGKVVMPGMIDAGDRLGLVEIPAEQITVDSTEYSDPIHSDLRVVDALNPRSELIRVARAEGITNALSEPAEGNLIAGQSAVINLDAETVEQMVVKSPAALHINLGETSKQTYRPKDKPPGTRMGAMAMVRQAFLRAENYRARHAAYAAGKQPAETTDDPESSGKRGRGGPPARDLKMEALLAALEGKLPVVISAHRVSDIEAALRLADEFHLKLILSHATAAWRIADQLAAKNIPVIVGPVQEKPTRMETLDSRLENAAMLHRAGVLIAFQTSSDTGVRDLPLAVEYAVGSGLPEDAALAAVTINPARFFGLEGQLGSLEPGKRANLIVLDGMPFRVKTHVVAEVINGKLVDLTNHQTELFQFYKRKYGIQ